MQIQSLSQSFGARIVDVDLSGPMDDDEFRALYDLFVKHKVVTFPGQQLTPEQQIAFTRRLGECDIHANADYHLEDYPEILILSNDQSDGKPIGVVDAGVEWHSDLSWQTDPTMASILYSHKTPSQGGNTGFVDMGCVYRLLDENTRGEISGLRGIHCVSKIINPRVTISENRVNAREFYEKQLKEHPPVTHPLVYQHPETGELILFANPRFTIGIEGMDDEEAQPLLDRLFAGLDWPEVSFEYEWSDNDVVMWDNRSVLHRACGGYRYPDIRYIHRTTVKCGDDQRLREVASI